MLTVVPQKDEEVAHVIDFREVAPLAATRDMFHGNELLARWVRIKLYIIRVCLLKPLEFQKSDFKALKVLERFWSLIFY